MRDLSELDNDALRLHLTTRTRGVGDWLEVARSDSFTRLLAACRWYHAAGLDVRVTPDAYPGGVLALRWGGGYPNAEQRTPEWRPRVRLPFPGQLRTWFPAWEHEALAQAWLLLQPVPDPEPEPAPAVIPPAKVHPPLGTFPYTPRPATADPEPEPPATVEIPGQDVTPGHSVVPQRLRKLAESASRVTYSRGELRTRTTSRIVDTLVMRWPGALGVWVRREDETYKYEVGWVNGMPAGARDLTSHAASA